jgi:hypothetical protein
MRELELVLDNGNIAEIFITIIQASPPHTPEVFSTLLPELPFQ